MTQSISAKKLLSYFFPELITVGLLYIGLEIINFRFLACTNIELCNATLFISNSVFHLMTKIAEGFSVGVVIMAGQYHGAGEYDNTGRVLAEAFWVTALVGACISLAIYVSAPTIYAFYEVPPEIITLGVPYLRTRSLAVFFSFIYFALIGFFRGIKNPAIPMVIFLLGAAVYLFFDYALIFGVWGFPELGLQGSAFATVIQFGVMLAAALGYLFLSPAMKVYRASFFVPLRLSTLRNLIRLSWPVMIDKASFALCPIWLNKMIGLTAKLTTAAEGKMMYDSFTVLKTMEQVGILPALAFAQVITYLVSNDYKIAHFTHIKKNIKKVLYIAAIFTGLFTLMFCLNPLLFLTMLNKPNAYHNFIAYTLPLIALLITFDVLQLILAAALRGASDVKTVMITRVAVVALFFIPLVYAIAQLPINNIFLKFLLLYGSTHLSYALMALVYTIRFKTGQWKKQQLPE